MVGEGVIRLPKWLDAAGKMVGIDAGGLERGCLRSRIELVM